MRTEFFRVDSDVDSCWSGASVVSVVSGFVGAPCDPDIGPHELLERESFLCGVHFFSDVEQRSPKWHLGEDGRANVPDAVRGTESTIPQNPFKCRSFIVFCLFRSFGTITDKPFERSSEERWEDVRSKRLQKVAEDREV